jgi:hypothetical protein
MSSSIDKLLDHVDQWKLKLHRKLRRMTAKQRKVFWKQVHEEAHSQGLRVVDLDKEVKPPRNGIPRKG